MDAKEIRTGRVEGVVSLPGSKSYTNRALLVAALADGESQLANPLWADDTQYMTSALRALGFAIEWGQECVRVRGLAGRIPAARAELYLGDAGTVIRLLTAAVCLGRGQFKLDGSQRLRERPIGELVACLRALGARVFSRGGCPPVLVEAAGLRGGRATMLGSISSQFFSAVLLAAPYSQQGVAIEVEDVLVSAPYVAMTLDIIQRFGVEVHNEQFRSFGVRAPQCYKALEYEIEPDASSATYFLAAAAITGGTVRIRGIDLESKQPDIQFARTLQSMGAHLATGQGWVEIRGGSLRGIEVDMNPMPDAVQTLAVTSLFAEGTTRIRNVANLKLKESDRIHDTATELRRLGASVEELPDGLIITPGNPQPAAIDPHNDHRMAMSFALAGLRIPGLRILNPGCVSKSLPDFFERLEALTR